MNYFKIDTKKKIEEILRRIEQEYSDIWKSKDNKTEDYLKEQDIEILRNDREWLYNEVIFQKNSLNYYKKLLLLYESQSDVDHQNILGDWSKL